MHFPETDQSIHTWTERFTKRVTDLRASYENTIRRVKNSMEVKLLKGTDMGKQFGLFKVSWEIGKFSS